MVLNSNGKEVTADLTILFTQYKKLQVTSTSWFLLFGTLFKINFLNQEA